MPLISARKAIISLLGFNRSDVRTWRKERDRREIPLLQSPVTPVWTVNDTNTMYKGAFKCVLSSYSRPRDHQPQLAPNDLSEMWRVRGCRREMIEREKAYKERET